MENSNSIKVFAVQVQKALESDLFNEMLGLIDGSKRDRILKFYHWHDAHRALFADLLVRMLLIRSKGIRNRDIFFSTLLFGKPVTNFPSFHFNVSHSGDWVVCAIDSQEIGVDIEKVGNIDLEISGNFFSKDEHADIINSEDPTTRFYDYWTLKESYIKYTGKGLSLPLDSFSIRFFRDGKIGIEADQTLLKDVHFKQYEFATEHKMAVCAGNRHFSDECTIYSIDNIIDTLRNFK